jgi:uncharacterized alkaline shock family protein YloU
MKIMDNNIGVVKISDEVIAIVSSASISEVKGVTGIYGGSKGGLFGMKNPNKGVKAEIKDNCVVIDIDIEVEYGANMPEVAWEIQGKIKTAVESMTGLSVSKVNVNIKGICLAEENKEEAEE